VVLKTAPVSIYTLAFHGSLARNTAIEILCREVFTNVSRVTRSLCGWQYRVWGAIQWAVKKISRAVGGRQEVAKHFAVCPRLTRYVNQREAAEFFLRRRGHSGEIAVLLAD
jgi:hypothetical protein